MTTVEFAQLVEIGHEARGVEFKAPGSRTDGPFFAEVARAALGMSNRRDGGVVVLGVIEVDKSNQFVGMEQAAVESWNYDDTSAGLSSYAEPNISFEIEILEFQTQKFVVLTIEEFEKIPVLCKREYKASQGTGRPDREVLRRGALYVRSRRKPETSEVATLEDMTEVLGLAIDKGVRQFVSRAVESGILKPGRIQQSEADTSTEERYESEPGGQW